LLAREDTRNTLLAGRLFVKKRGLNSGDLQWIQKRVMAQSQKSTGSTQQYWKFVQRVCARRNQ